jgi:hypothetical protein
MQEPTKEPSGDKCFCCGTPVEKINEPYRFRRKWRIKFLLIMGIGLVMVAVSFALFFNGLKAMAFPIGIGFGIILMGTVLVDKFPRLRKQKKP